MDILQQENPENTYKEAIAWLKERFYRIWEKRVTEFVTNVPQKAWLDAYEESVGK